MMPMRDAFGLIIESILATTTKFNGYIKSSILVYSHTDFITIRLRK